MTAADLQDHVLFAPTVIVVAVILLRLIIKDFHRD